ncbi:hypothetical protein ODQ99_25980, partial [Escherichia coli]|nr:hypothetical protein [Escherichia coli]
IQRGKPPEWWEKQKGSRGIRRGQWYRLVFQFPIREQGESYRLKEKRKAGVLTKNTTPISDDEMVQSGQHQ